MRILLLPLALLPTAALAEIPDETIVVTATRTEQPLSAIGQSISVLDATTIETRQSVSVAELLRDLPSIAYARTGGPGGVTSIYIRGANADQTIVLIDGVKLNDPSSTAGGFFFGDLLTGNIDRVEVLRGSQSVLWGSQSIGGVVNLITRAPTDTPSANLRAEYGWHNSANLVGNISGRSGAFSASVGGGWYDTDGISTLGTRYGGVERDGYRNYGANARIGIDLSEDISVDLRGWYADGFWHDDDVDFLVDNAASLKSRQWVGYAGLNAALLDGRFHNRIALTYTDTSKYSVSTWGNLAFAGRNARLEYQGSYDLGPGTQLSFGAEHEKQEADAFDPTASAPSAKIGSVYALLIAAPLKGLTLTGGARYDHHSSFGGHSSLSASAAWTPNDGATILRASFGEGFKAPSLYQLYGNFGANPALNPELAKGWDAGIEQKLIDGTLDVSLTWFARTTTNQVQFSNMAYSNIARARARGIEAQIVAHPAKDFTVSATYSYVDAQDRSVASPDYGLQLIRRPKDTISVSADYRWACGFAAGATIRLVGARRDIAFDENFSPYNVRLASYSLVDARVSYPITDTVEIYGRIENLFDQYYETVVHYGTPGRSAFAGVRLKL